jgi:hypothetical protein
MHSIRRPNHTTPFSIGAQHRCRGKAFGAVAVCLFGLACPSPLVHGQAHEDYELPPIQYSKTAPKDAVSAIEARLASGTTRPPDDPKGFVRWLLEELRVPEESQVLVFSKTSLQRDLIRPDHPRAMFFSDSAYVGWVPGGLLEVTSFDPVLGATFYGLDPRAATLKFDRSDNCMSCHGGSMTRKVPGLMVRSVFPDHRGEPILSAGTFLVTHETPLEDRWGGYYVTGTHGAARHMGNVIARETPAGATLDRDLGANVTDLTGRFPTERYLRPTSDIVALIVLEHQIGAHNAILHANLWTRLALHRLEALKRELGAQFHDGFGSSTRSVINNQADRVLEQLLFVRETPISRISGDTAFQSAFLKARRADAQGRSLRDFDLKTRVFKYRCSYLIYSPVFDGLPEIVRETVLTKLWTILTSSQAPPPFQHLADAERAAIREILAETKPGLPACWQTTSNPPRSDARK